MSDFWIELGLGLVFVSVAVTAFNAYRPHWTYTKKQKREIWNSSRNGL
jgi:hypothetical protein